MNKDNSHLSILPLDKTGSIGADGSTSRRALQAIEGNHAQLSTQLQEYYGRKRSWLAAIFPSKLDKVLADGQLNLAKNEIELNERVVELACQMKLEACRETAEVWIMSMKLETRGSFIAFVTQKVDELEQTIEERRLSLAERLRRRAAAAEKNRDIPVFYEQYCNSMNREIMETLTWLDQLMERFRSIADDRVADYGRTTLPIR